MSYNFDTLALHAGQVSDEQFCTRVTQIYLTNSFVLGGSDQVATLFNRVEQPDVVFDALRESTP